jgi:predicted amidohydrolase YtcJ
MSKAAKDWHSSIRTRAGVLLFAFFFFSFVYGAAPSRAADDVVLFHAKVFTGEPDHPYAEAVAIHGDKIVAVGNRGDVAKAVASDAKLIDLKGNFLMPGMIDSHCHAIGGGMLLISAIVSEDIRTMDQLLAFAADAQKSGRGMHGDILMVSGVPLAFWSKNAELNDRFNSGPYASEPVFLEGMDHHTAWANRAMFKRAGITKEMIRALDETGRGYYGHAPDFEPNGFLVDVGSDRAREVIPKPSEAQLLAAGRAAVQYMHEQGITAWLDAAANKEDLDTYRTLAERGELNVHVSALPVIGFKEGHPDEDLKTALEWREHFNSVPGVKIVGIKVFADGVLEIPSQTAVLSKPYRNTGKNGELLFNPPDFARIAIAADKDGLLVHVHAIGDRAVTEALNGFEAVRKANGYSGLPDTITHLQLVRPEDIPRFHQLSVIAAFQLYWAAAETDTIELVKPYIDPELYAWQYPARSILDAGGVISGASDWPVSTANPFRAIYQAETRKGPEGVLDASQSMPREAMLYAYTRNAAGALAMQDQIGSLAPGKQADFALIDRDVLTVSAEDARDAKVLWTVVGGKTVYGSQP